MFKQDSSMPQMTNESLIEKAASIVNPRKIGDYLVGDVGAALVTDKGNLYLGVCMDISSEIGFCAEHSAIAAMVTAGEYRIAKIVAVWKNDMGETFILSPCGRCREFIRQIHPDNLTTFAQDGQHGRFFFSRYKIGAQVYDRDGQTLDLLRWLRQPRHTPRERTVWLGQPRLPVRLLALPVPPEQVGNRRRLRATARRKQQPVSDRALALAAWTLYVTTIPPDLLALHEAPLLGCTRWQIECLFDLWKNAGALGQSRSHDPHRVWCEFYATLLALLIQHWLTLVSCWQRLNRSLHRATQLIRKYAFALLHALPVLPALVALLDAIAPIIAHPCALSKRVAHPLTFQRWLDGAHP